MHAVEALLRTLSFDLLMAAFLPETTINLGTDFGTQTTSSQQVQVTVVERRVRAMSFFSQRPPKTSESRRS
jgi:hypothetical protein